jgi:hypothetical protein
MRLLTFVLNALWEEACRIENGSSFHSFGPEYVKVLSWIKATLIDYCCVVWGNCSNEGLNRILKLQKRTARLILDQAIYLVNETGVQREIIELPQINDKFYQIIIIINSLFIESYTVS